MIQRHDPTQHPNEQPVTRTEHTADAENTADELIAPGSPRPLSPQRTNWRPDDEPGTDELAGEPGPTPAEAEPDTARDQRPFDIDPDNAERDDQSNPR